MLKLNENIEFLYYVVIGEFDAVVIIKVGAGSKEDPQSTLDRICEEVGARKQEMTGNIGPYKTKEDAIEMISFLFPDYNQIPYSTVSVL